MKQNLEKYCIDNGMFGDITFELDDGRIRAHRAILVARCEVMRAMLNGAFREAHAQTVKTKIIFLTRPEFKFHFILDLSTWRDRVHIP